MSVILILGGYGGFGGRLSRRLAAAGHAVIVAGRSLDRAERFCRAAPGCRPLRVDRDGDIAAVLAAERPDLVIDSAGPFQGSGTRVPQACAAARVPYLDLADDRAFVAGISSIAADVPVISGASSVPALSGAVTRDLVEGMDRVTAVEAAISASNQAAAGPSVAAAILASVGRPMPLWRGQRWTIGHGWQEMRREVFALTDGTTLGTRRVGLVDVPDLTLLPGRIAARPAVSFRAGTELDLPMAALWIASWPVRWFGGSLRGFAGCLRPLQRLTARLGSDRSGMVVRVFGWAEGRRLERRWTLIAERGDGPELPVLAAAILARRILAGQIAAGARDAGEALSLSDFEPEFAKLAVRHEVRTIVQPDTLYRRVLGPAFDALPGAVRALHDVLRDGGASGRATVTRGKGMLARMVAAVVGFPPEGDHGLHVSFREADGIETWTRDFDGRVFGSRLYQDGTRLTEQFGPLRFRFDLTGDANGLRMTMVGWSAFGVALPMVLAPRSPAHEGMDEKGRFTFDVAIALPLIGPVVHYRGWLVPL